MLDTFLNRIIFSHEVLLLTIHQHFARHHISRFSQINFKSGNIKVSELVLMEDFVQEFVQTTMQLLNITDCHLSPDVLIRQVHACFFLVNVSLAECVENCFQVD